MFAIRVIMQKLNEDGTPREEKEEHYIMNLQESGGTYNNPYGNVLKFDSFDEAEKIAKQMKLKSYNIVEV